MSAVTRSLPTAFSEAGMAYRHTRSEFAPWSRLMNLLTLLARSCIVTPCFGLITTTLAVAADPDSGDQPEPEWYSLHGQVTVVTQYHPSFTSPFAGQNSLNPGNRGNETVSATLFAGIRVWDGLEFYADPEIDQGFGLSNTLGLADFSSGEAYKVGSALPYVRLQRAFARYTLGLGGEVEADAPGANQLGGSHLADNLTFTVGKFNITDLFDTNSYAHDPRGDFLNWGILDGAAFNYAADAWGYTYGGAAEWTQSWWTLRAGLFDLSRVPNSPMLVRGFGEFSTVAEFEVRENWLGPPGKVKFLAFENSGNMANYNDAVRAALGTGLPPNVADVRRFSTQPGAEFNAEQEIMPDLGAFLRVSLNDGHKEAYEFTDANSSVSGGFQLSGARWGRSNDTIGLAGVISGVSSDARNYLAAGGLGILVGDGRLPKYDPEEVLELYYNATIIDGITFGVDYQHVANPAYDALRGPVDIFGFRVHGEF
jgi:high affinity Mn2+ porin